MVRPMPTPNARAQASYQKPTFERAKLPTPATIIVTIPNTRWWTCRPPSLTMRPRPPRHLGAAHQPRGEPDESERAEEPDQDEEVVLPAVVDQLVVPEVRDERGCGA